MTELIYVLLIICVVLSYLSMGVYYLWISLIAFFPKIQKHKDIPYREGMDMHFFVVVPCLNEEGVIVDAVRSILKANMKNMRVIVVDDDSQDNTVANLMHAFQGSILLVDVGGSPSWPDICMRMNCSGNKGKSVILLRRRRPNAQLGKGKSLTYAYGFINEIIKHEGLKPSKCIMGVIDADTYVSRRVFERAAVILYTERDVAIVQARIRIGTFTRDHFLPLFQDLEFFVYINNMQNVREYTGTVSAAGNGQFNRFSAIDPERPWTDCLLEDYDFSLRMLLKGWRTRLLQEDRVYQQGVLTYKRFVRQRSRWCQGGIQCLPYLKYVRHSRYISTYGKIEIIFFMMLPFITLVSVFSQIISWFVIVYYYVTDQSIIFSLFAPYPIWELMAVLVIITMFVYVPGVAYGLLYRSDTKENAFVCILAGFFQPIYNLMQIPAVMMAFWRQITRQKGWIKTQHFDESKRHNYDDYVVSGNEAGP